ncbi:MAG: hypothetical protein ABSD74_20810 [Rhizomicrobium sp.]|jgi:hypothetical protein
MRYKRYIPQNASELLDQLAYMMLDSPTFEDRTGYFPEENIDTTFYSLNHGLMGIRKTLGEERYAAFTTMSDKMRTLFESDAENKTGDAKAGRALIHEMENILMEVARREEEQ